jgi:type II secretory pathway component PulJ
MLDRCSDVSRLVLAASVAISAVVLVLAARTLRILREATRAMRDRQDLARRINEARSRAEDGRLAALPRDPGDQPPHGRR